MKTGSELAITAELPKILNLIVKNEVVAVDIPTGCGKSIGIPRAVFDGTKMRLFCSQPTIASVIGLFEYQSKQIKNAVGWAAEGTQKYDKSTRIVYATSGHIRRRILKCFQNGKATDVTFCEVLMLDEIHTGSKDNSIIIDLWCEAKKQGVKVPKLLLSTATASGVADVIQRLGAVVFSSTFRTSEVEVRYCKKEYEEPDDEGLMVDAAHAAIDLLMETKTHGIVFCSGSGECEDMIHSISEIIAERKCHLIVKKTIKVLPCFSQCKREEIMTAIMVAPPNVIHIVCATNVAESSLTIPDVSWVVDTMSEKRSSIKGGRFHLGVTWISKNSAKQREGRTGRTVKKGICYRMMSKRLCDKLEQSRPLEIRNSPISDTVIELLDVGLDPCKIITELCRERLYAAKETLVETGCILIKKETYESLAAEVTPCGRFSVQLPMDVRNAASLYYFTHGKESKMIPMPEDKNMFWPIAAMVLIDTYGPSLLWFPRRKKDEAPSDYQVRMGEYAQDNFSEVESECPIETLCRFFASCMSEYDSNIFTAPWRLSKWAGQNSANGKKLKEICMTMKRICYSLSSDFDTEFQPEANHDEVIARIMPQLHLALSMTYGTKTLRPVWMRFGPAHQDQRGQIVNVDTTKTVVNSRPHGEEVISLSDIQVENKKTGKVTNISSLWFRKPIDIRRMIGEDNDTSSE
jgi:HrpA-like RNA helicase